MSRAFFEELGIPDADINLGIGSGTHAEQVGRTMIAFEKVVREHRPDWVVVVGDVNATCACSITAKKEHVRLAHIEAGLRSGDMDMPEEINRLVTDRLSDLLFTPDRLSSANLRAEGVPEERIRFVGNIMIDTLEANRAKAAALDIDAIIAANLLDGGRGRCPQTPAGGRRDSPRSPLDLACGDAAGMRPQEAGLAAVSPHASNGESEGTRSLGGGTQSEASNDPPREGLLSAQREGAGPRLSPLSTAYAVMTMHRPSNVDQAETLVPIMEFLLQEVAQEMPLLWPIHPRARKQLEAFGLWPRVLACENLVLLEPLGYLEMLRLNLGARVMLTDSGGLQEECCVLGTPCLTLRWNTERPITLAEHGGASVLVGNDVARMRQAYRAAVSQDRRPSCPELWDGHAAERIVAALVAAG
jgi:UDP-N-acetylglucosamine 2-epimerase